MGRVWRGLGWVVVVEEEEGEGEECIVLFFLVECGGLVVWWLALFGRDLVLEGVVGDVS